MKLVLRLELYNNQNHKVLLLIFFIHSAFSFKVDNG